MRRIGAIRRNLAVAAAVAALTVLAALPVRAQQSPSGDPVFVTASVDNDQPYIGQQITYISKIYQRSDSSRSLHYDPPGFAGFWNVRETEQSQYDETVDSAQYRVIELRTILFPSVVETIEIEPSVLTVPASPSEDPIVVESVPVLVKVRPTPEDAPSGFTGAVGRFEIAAQVDTTTVLMNQSVQLTVAIQGTGNIDALPAPSWPEFRGWRVIESPAAANSVVIDGQLVGSRTYESVLVPETPGELSVPEISYAYFDPVREQYAQATTSPITVSVAEADGETPLPPISVSGVEDETALPGTKHIRAVPSSLSKSARAMTDSVAYWAVWGLPLLAIAGAGGLATKARRLGSCSLWTHVGAMRCRTLNRGSHVPGRPEMTTQSMLPTPCCPTCRTDSESPLTGLTREALGERIRDAGAPADVVERVQEILASGEAARYTPEAPSEGHREDRVRRATQLLAELDGAIET